MDKTEMQPESHAACSGENGNVINGAQPNEAGMNPRSDHLVFGNNDSSSDADVLVEALVTEYGSEYSEAKIQRSIQLYEKRRKMRYTRGHAKEILEIMDEMIETVSAPSKPKPSSRIAAGASKTAK